jgi:hypothetical protein
MWCDARSAVLRPEKQSERATQEILYEAARGEKGQEMMRGSVGKQVRGLAPAEGEAHKRGELLLPHPMSGVAVPQVKATNALNRQTHHNRCGRRFLCNLIASVLCCTWQWVLACFSVVEPYVSYRQLTNLMS